MNFYSTTRYYMSYASYISLISRQAISRILFRIIRLRRLADGGAETIIYLDIALPLYSSEPLFSTSLKLRGTSFSFDCLSSVAARLSAAKADLLLLQAGFTI